MHALEALVLARYYMFTQVYFNVTGKALELHLNEWLRERTAAAGRPTPSASSPRTTSAVLVGDARARRARTRAPCVERDHFPLAFETREHLHAAEKRRASRRCCPSCARRFGAGNLLVSNSAKDPHRLGAVAGPGARYDGALEPMEQASQFIRHLTRIERSGSTPRPDRCAAGEGGDRRDAGATPTRFSVVGYAVLSSRYAVLSRRLGVHRHRGAGLVALRDRHVGAFGRPGVDLARPVDARRRGRRCISFQWAIQPGRRPSANITVNMLVGMPIAR